MKNYQILLFCGLIILSSALWCEIGFKRGFNTGKIAVLKEWNSSLDSQICELKTQRDARLFINHSEIK